MEWHLASIWESIADETPDEDVVVQGGRRRSWAAFDDRASRLAAGLLTAGLGQGSVVAEYLHNGAEYLESFAAALKIRAVPVNVNYRYLDDELLYLLEDSGAEALVYHASLADRVARVCDRARGLKILVEVDDGPGESVPAAVRYENLLAAEAPVPRIDRSAEDPIIIYTGGTTGMPKGVVQPVGPLVQTMLDSTLAILGLPPVAGPDQLAGVARGLADGDRRLVSLPACPLMHGTGLGIGAIAPMLLGGAVVLLEGRGLDVSELWGTVERERVVAITIVGDAFARPMLHGLETSGGAELGSLRFILSSGAMFSAEVKTGLVDRLPGVLIVDALGASEGMMGIALTSKDIPATTGRFLPSPGVRVFDEEGRPVEAGSGRAGMVAIAERIPNGYHGDEAKTAQTFRTIAGVRYSIPGDWATVEADGSLALLGRGSHCINTGGEKVYPEEVEEVLKRHPAVEDCLIFGVADERFGQRVAGVVALSYDVEATTNDVVNDARDRLASYKLPRELVRVDVVPRGPSGKGDYPAARLLFDGALRSASTGDDD